MKPRIAVIGAGVIGLSVARSLALRGAAVTVLDTGAIGAGTSTTTYAWVNSNGKSPASYHRLNVEGMHEHRRLQAQGPGEARWLEACGTVEWASSAAQIEQLHKRAQALSAKGYAVQPGNRAELAARIPELKLPGEAVPIWCFPDESLVCPTLFIAFLRSEALRLGVTIRPRTPVTALAEHASGVRLRLGDASDWSDDFDFAVSAAGRWTAPLLATLGVELAMVDANLPGRVGCGFLGYTAPAPIQLRSNLITSEINIRPDGGGRLILQVLDLDHLADPSRPVPADGDIARHMLARLGQVMHQSEGVQIERIAVGQRSRPADGLPAVGFVTDRQRVYVVATHSGITLAPALGPLVAGELLQGSGSPLLEDYRPGRLIGKASGDFAPIATNHFPAAQ